MNRQCQYCFKAFSCAYNKKRHENICLELQAKNRLHCYICGKGYVSVQKRVKHENQCVNIGANLLQDLKKFQCEKCHHTFASKQMWKQHSCTVKTNGNIEVIEKNKCETCSKTFSSVFNKKDMKKYVLQLKLRVNKQRK